jgi:hypothetical protein
MSTKLLPSQIPPEAVMRDVIVVFGLVILGVLSSLAVSFKFTSFTAQPDQSSPSVEQLMADAPPSERRGTPGERS